MSADDDRLDDLAGSVSDGRPVDWGAAESGAGDDGEHAEVRALRELARIAEFNRDLQRAEPPAPEPPARWGDLLLLEPVGAGASGQVWRAWDERLRREVALKLLPPRAGDAPAGASPLLDEARALARVRHASVVAVHGVAEHEGRAGMWMELLRGSTLADTIERGGALPAPAVARLGAELAGALAAVHAAGLVHGDVKPANVSLEPDGRVVLADFGLSARRALGGADPLRRSGTPLFMAPERLAGGAPSSRSDLYALGVTLRCALTGRPPFAARTVAELLDEARRGPARALAEERPDAPPALVAAIERAMAPDPERRFASAEELARALAAAPAPGRGSGRALRALAFAGAALAAVAALWLALRPAPARRPAGGLAVRGAPGAESPAYDVEATLVRREHGRFQPLAPGDRVGPGDRLSLEFRATRPAWVYVLDEDERGASFLLFPQPLFDVANPVPADSTLMLPGPVGGRENAWTVTSRGRREHFLVVASPAPVPEIEAELRRIPPARPGRAIEYAAVTAPALERLRGVGGVAPLPADTTVRRSGMFERFEALAGRETGVRGIWVRQVTLENPLR